MSDLKIGVGARDISPARPQLLQLTGIARKTRARDVELPLRAEALAMACGGSRLFIITSDLQNMRHEWSVPVRKQVVKTTGCDSANIIFSNTHCHSSDTEEPENATAEEKDARAEHFKAIIQGLIGACLAAHADLKPAEIAATRAHLSEPIGECRRMVYSTGACLNNWGAGAIAIPGTRFMGPTCPPADQIDIFCARRPGEASPFVIMTGYGSHLHLSGSLYFNSETAGGVKAELEKRLPGATAMYSNAAGGNMDMHCIYPMPLDADAETELRWLQKSRAILAKRFADAVMPALPALRYERPSRILHESYFSSNPEDVEHPMAMVLHALALGDFALVNMQGEMFSEYAVELHRRSPFPQLFVQGYNDTDDQYVGMPLDYEQGAYELGGLLPRSEAEAAEFKAMKFGIAGSTPARGREIVERLIAMLQRLRVS